MLKYLHIIITLVAFAGCSGLFSSEPTKLRELENAPQQIEDKGLVKTTPPKSSILEISAIGGDTNHVITVHANGSILLWDVSSGAVYNWGELPEKPEQVTINKDKGLLAFVSKGKISVINLLTKENFGSTSQVRAKVIQLRFQSDGRAILAAAADGRIYRWKFLQEASASSQSERERAFEKYVSHNSVVSALAEHPFGRVFFSADWLGTLLAWLPYDSDAYQGEYDKNLFGARFFASEATHAMAERTPDKGITDMVVSPDGKRLIVASQDGYLEVWQVQGFKIIAKIRANQGLLYSISISPTGQLIAAVGRDGVVRVFKIRKDESFGIRPEALAYELVEIQNVKIPEVEHVYFLVEDSLLAATTSGKVLEVSGGRVEPAPTPLNVSKPDSDIQTQDHDY